MYMFVVMPSGTMKLIKGAASFAATTTAVKFTAAITTWAAVTKNIADAKAHK